MARMHVRESTSGKYSIVCHFTVPAGNNAAGLAWRTALLRLSGGASRPNPTVLPDGDGTLGTIDASEKTDVTNCVLAERILEFAPTSDWDLLTLGQKAAALDAWFTEEQTKFDDWRSAALNEYGRVRT